MKRLLFALVLLGAVACGDDPHPFDIIRYDPSDIVECVSRDGWICQRIGEACGTSDLEELRECLVDRGVARISLPQLEQAGSQTPMTEWCGCYKQ